MQGCATGVRARLVVRCRILRPCRGRCWKATAPEPQPTARPAGSPSSRQDSAWPARHLRSGRKSFARPTTRALTQRRLPVSLYCAPAGLSDFSGIEKEIGTGRFWCLEPIGSCSFRARVRMMLLEATNCRSEFPSETPARRPTLLERWRRGKECPCSGDGCS